MNATLKVKNFGPIKDVELDLRDVNVFIGPQASGKSVLAKLYTICKSPSLFSELRKKQLQLPDLAEKFDDLIPNYSQFKNSLDHFSIGDFMNTDTEIHFFSTLYDVNICNEEILYTDKFSTSMLLNEVERENYKGSWEIYEDLKSKIQSLSNSMNFSIILAKIIKALHGKESNLEVSSLSDDPKFYHSVIVAVENIKQHLYSKKAFYIPAERTLAVILKQAAPNLLQLNVPISQHLLEYVAHYNSATYKIANFDLNFLQGDLTYENNSGIDYLNLNVSKKIKLSESASGFQSVIPLLLSVKFHKEDNKNLLNHNPHQAFVIEEPETNLFPKAQYALLKYLEKNRPDDEGKIDTGSVHIYTTHSPFILSSLNNMLYAYKKGNAASTKVQEEIAQILPKENWISPERFSAYQIVDGKAESIFDRESGLIQENIIDQISDDIIEDFRSIAIATMES